MTTTIAAITVALVFAFIRIEEQVFQLDNAGEIARRRIQTSGGGHLEMMLIYEQAAVTFVVLCAIVALLHCIANAPGRVCISIRIGINRARRG